MFHITYQSPTCRPLVFLSYSWLKWQKSIKTMVWDLRMEMGWSLGCVETVTAPLDMTVITLSSVTRLVHRALFESYLHFITKVSICTINNCTLGKSKENFQKLKIKETITIRLVRNYWMRDIFKGFLRCCLITSVLHNLLSTNKRVLRLPLFRFLVPR